MIAALEAPYSRPVSDVMVPPRTMARVGEFPMAFTNIRMWQPSAPGVMELWVWEFDYKCTHQAHKDNAYLAGQFGFGAGGIFE
ncbi:hypothetical protein [Sphingobium xenophagum]